MTAAILQFPQVGPFVVSVERERDSEAWLAVCREHGWLHSSNDDAFEAAQESAAGFGVAMKCLGKTIHIPTEGAKAMTQQQFDNRNTGALFKVDEKESEKHPDYRGTIDVDGRPHWLAAWLKTSKKGVKYLSLSITPKDNIDRTKPKSAAAAELNDFIPF